MEAHQGDPRVRCEQASRLSGLALSGGGIRSASFALGVLQGLARAGVLERVDYLSTVSGGGYIGSSLTWFVHRGYSVKGGKVPFGVPGEGVREARPGKGKGEKDVSDRSRILNFLRQRGNYLDPGKGLNLASLFAVVLRSMVLALAVYVPVLVAALFLAETLDGFEPLPLLWSIALNAFHWAAALLAAIFLVCSAAYSVFTYPRRGESFRRYGFRVGFQRWMGWVWALVVVLAVIGTLPFAKDLTQTWWHGLWSSGITAGLLTLFGAVGGLIRFRREQTAKKPRESPASLLNVWASAVVLVYGLLLLAYIAASELHWPWIAGLLAAGVGLGWFVNLNHVSLHRMYRDRLMEAFLPNPAEVAKSEWAPATEADGARLEDMCAVPKKGSGQETGPYHLINTNVVLVDSGDAKFRGRGGDSFILSPLYCGSDATKWCSTNDFMKRGGKGGMTLSTAMAISGAAMNPHTGVAGLGYTRNRTVSFLMTILNLRLGYWAPRPRQGVMPWPPNYFRPGFKSLIGRGFDGKGFDEESRFIQLTDGGHFDNTGLYELIRREVRTIILSDATADREFTFSDLGHLVERVRADFGADIRFADDDTDLVHIMPGTAGGGVFPEKYGLARRGYAIGTIRYRSGKEGILFYIKSTLTKGLPADIYGYKSADPDFPDQSTSDQFFDEFQFEAYRELGYRLARQMCGEVRDPNGPAHKYASFLP